MDNTGTQVGAFSFQKVDSTNLYSLQERTRVPFLHLLTSTYLFVFLITAILTDVVLICIYLMINLHYHVHFSIIYNS